MVFLVLTVLLFILGFILDVYGLIIIHNIIMYSSSHKIIEVGLRLVRVGKYLVSTENEAAFLILLLWLTRFYKSYCGKL